MNNYSIKIVSEDSILIEWTLAAELPTPHDAAMIGSLANHLANNNHRQIINVTPAYKTLLVQFDVLRTDASKLPTLLEQAIEQQFQPGQVSASNTLHQIPTYYDASVAADLTDICRAKGLSVEQLIEQHTAAIYTVYSIGFQPGFAYLGYVPEVLETLRHSSFRGNVPAGSVGIADRQTAVYPTESPGGWQIIGRTPKKLINDSHAVLQAGDQVQFVAIDQAEYLSLGGKLTEATSTA